jgi:hypothetical protein
MDSWGIDVVLTASQKGLGAPPGLSVVVVSQKAMKVIPPSVSCRIERGGVDNFSRFLRRARNRSRRSMPAGRGKGYIYIYISDALLNSRLPYSPTAPQMAPHHEGVRERKRLVLCDSAGQPDPCVPRVLVPDNQRQPVSGRALQTASRDQPSHQGRRCRARAVSAPHSPRNSRKWDDRGKQTRRYLALTKFKLNSLSLTGGIALSRSSIPLSLSLSLFCSSGAQTASSPPSFCPPSCKGASLWQVV